MKIQDYFFLIILLLLIIKKNYRLSVFLGLLAFLISIPLFARWIFFTAERLTWYGAAFIFLSLLQKTLFNFEFKFKNWKKVINIFLISITLINVSSVIYTHKDRYFKGDFWQRYPKLKYIYENSQYVSKNPKMGWIPDEFVFSYAGGAFIKGTSPILIAAGSAPLGKYLIGLSALLTGNENIIIIISSLVSLLFMYLLGLQIFSNKTLALIPPLLLSLEPIFKNQLVYVPLLDIIQLPFLLASFYFFNKGVIHSGTKKLLYFILANISLGGFISVKFFVTGFIIIAAWYLALILRKDLKSLISLTVALPFSLLVLVLSYFKVFLEGYTLKQFFGIQKWIFLYHKSKLILPFSVWPLILFNKWYVWYGDKPIISDPQWRLTWPIIQITALVSTALYLWNKINKKREVEILIIWSILYILFSSFGNISSRYLVIYLPVLYLISIFGIKSLMVKFFQKRK